MSLYNPLDPVLPRPRRRARRARPHVPGLQRLPDLRAPVPELPLAVRDGRRQRQRRRRREGAHRRRARACGRRVLPVQALLRRVPVRARARAGARDRLPAPHAPVARDPGEGGQGAGQRQAPRAHRPPGQGRNHLRSGRERDEHRRCRPHGDAEGHRHRQGPAPAHVRAGALHQVVPSPGRGTGRRAARHRRAVPDVPRRVPGPVDRQGRRRRLRAQPHRVRGARRPGVLRHAVARRRRRSTSSASSRRRTSPGSRRR